MSEYAPSYVPDDTESPTRRPPTARHRVERLRGAVTTLSIRLFTATAGMYVAAGSIIGLESLALLLSYAALWPVAIPILIAAIVIVGTIVRRARSIARRREPIDE